MMDMRFEALKSQIKDIEVKFTPEKVNLDEIIDNNRLKYICIRKSFEKDFLSVIKLVQSSKLKVTQTGKLPDKISLVRMNEVLKNKEILDSYTYDINVVRAIENTTRLYAIYSLLKYGNILDIDDEIIVLGENTEDFLALSIVDKCKYLLGTYLQSKIDEFSRIKGMKLLGLQPYFKEYREKVLDYLTMAPVDEWIKMKDFYHIIEKTGRNFITDAAGDIRKYDDYNEYYHSANNGEICERFLDIVFIEYLSTLGIVDLIIEQDYSDYDYLYFSVKYFKFTPFGTYVLGMNDKEDSWL